MTALFDNIDVQGGPKSKPLSRIVIKLYYIEKTAYSLSNVV